MLLGRPIMVWVIAAFLGIPAVFYVVTHILVVAGMIAAPSNMTGHLDPMVRTMVAINGAEAIALTVCVAFLLAMKRISLPLFVVYFAIDVLHTFSGMYLEEGSSLLNQVLSVGMAVLVVGYVWRLQRKDLLH